MTDVAAIGAFTGFGALLLGIVGLAWNVTGRFVDRIDREVLSLRERMRSVEHGLGQLRPLVPVAKRVAERSLEDELE